MSQTENRQNPWAGLSSYEDPAKSKQPLKFCGRDRETKEVSRLIDDNFFVTLYGKSGIGKTSLLNAGVFPALRRDQYTSLSMRLGMTDESQTFQEIITQAIEHAITEVGGSVQIINVTDEPSDCTATDYLWRWFARRRFLTADGQITFPVLVFDQFEEVFRQADSRKKAEVLLNQLNYLVDESHAIGDSIVEGKEYSYDFNFRFVLSIREDDLYRLEDSLDNCSLPALKRCRYRLRSLSEQGAREVILIPGEEFFREGEKEQIVEAIVGKEGKGGKARNEDGSISTNIVSLLCNRIFVDFQKSDADRITPALVDNFIKGNPFERFYNEATRGFSNREKSYIEEHLVDSTGRRNSLPESDFLRYVKNGAVLLEGERKILQRTSTSSDSRNYRVELIHDSFCEPLAALKEKRERRKRLKWLAYAATILLLLAGITAYIANMSVRNLQLEGENVNLTDSLRLALKQAEQDRDVARFANLQKDSTLLLLGLRNAQLDSSFLQLSERERQLYASNQGFLVNQSRVLAEKATQLVDDGDSYLARLIALEAWEKANTVEAESAIRIAVEHNNAILRGHIRYVTSASFSPDGKRIVSASWDKTVRIWDAQTGRQIGKPLEGHTDIVYSAAFSPDGKRIVSASWDKTVRIWDAQTGRQIGKPLEGHTRSVTSASFSPDGKRIVSASWDKTVRIWDAQTGRQIGKPLEGHTDNVTSAAFSPDGKRIVSASWDKTVRIWDAQTGRQIGQPLEGHTSSVISASFSPDGERIVSASRDKTVLIWDAQTGRQIGQPLEGHTNSVSSTSFSPDGKRIVSASWDNTVRIWDAQTDRPIGQLLKGHTSSVNSAAFSPDGKRIVSASLDKTVRIWDAQTGRQIGKPLEGHNIRVNSAAFSPDGKRIVSASDDKTVRIWDAQTGRQIGPPLEGHTFGVYSAAFSPDGKRIVSASSDNTVRIWDAQTGRQIGQPLEGHTNSVSSASFSPDGRRIVSASDDNTVRIWDAQTGRQIGQPLEGHTSSVNSAAFSPDGKRIVSASWDNTVRIWDAQKGRQIGQPLEGHTSSVESASFSPDGKRIVSASEDYTVRIWEFPPIEQLVDDTRKRFKNRPLTQEERRKYYLE